MLINLRYGKVGINMIKKITNSFGWKIISVVAAFLIWLLVVNYEDPINTREINNLQVIKLNSNAITSQNKAIEFKEGETVNVTLRGKRSIIDRITKNDLRAYADLSQVSITGAIDIEIDVPEGIQVISKRPSDMKIALENIVSVQKEVQYYFDGEPGDSYVALEPVITPSIIQITGPESQVNMVSSIMIPINIKGVQKDVTLFAAPQALDKDDKVVTAVTMNVDRVQVSVPIIKKKTIPIIFEKIDDVPQGYRLTEVKLDVNEISIVGKEEIINTIDSITINNISLQGRTENTTVNVSLEDLIDVPGVTIYSREKTTNITFVINRLEEKIIVIEPDDIQIRNTPRGLNATIQNEIPISLTFRGIRRELDNLSIVDLAPHINLTGLEEGMRETKLNINVPSDVELLTEPTTIRVNLELR